MIRSNVLRLVIGTLALGMTLAVSALAAPSDAAPDFALTTLDGKTISKASLAGKPTLLMFWASWCGTCQHELPNVKALYEQHKAEGLQAVAIGFQDSEANIRGYVQSHQRTFVFPAAYDTRNQVSTLFRARGTPTFVLLDAEGRVALVHTGGGILQNPVLQQFIQTF
ncbi:MAG: TlpA family protein disulfide reductase [Nitrospirota bacterium]